MNVISFNSLNIPVRNIVKYKKTKTTVPLFVGEFNHQKYSFFKHFFKKTQKIYPEIYKKQAWILKEIDLLYIKIQGEKDWYKLYSKNIKTEYEKTKIIVNELKDFYNLLSDKGFMPDILNAFLNFNWEYSFSDVDIDELFDVIHNYNLENK